MLAEKKTELARKKYRHYVYRIGCNMTESGEGKL